MSRPTGMAEHLLTYARMNVNFPAILHFVVTILPRRVKTWRKERGNRFILSANGSFVIRCQSYHESNDKLPKQIFMFAKEQEAECVYILGTAAFHNLQLDADSLFNIYELTMQSEIHYYPNK